MRSGSGEQRCEHSRHTQPPHGAHQVGTVRLGCTAAIYLIHGVATPHRRGYFGPSGGPAGLRDGVCDGMRIGIERHAPRLWPEVRRPCTSIERTADQRLPRTRLRHARRRDPTGVDDGCGTRGRDDEVIAHDRWRGRNRVRRPPQFPDVFRLQFSAGDCSPDHDAARSARLIPHP
jgi:hypothetical protein